MNLGVVERVRGSRAHAGLVVLILISAVGCTTAADRPSAPDGLRNTTEIKAIVAHLCVSCHGEKGISPVPLFPNLAGQDAGYLYNQLRRFNSGVLEDSPMTAVAALVDEMAFRGLASYYSGMPPATAAPIGDRSMFERGAKIFREGLVSAEVPPCAGCHGENARGMGKAAPIPAIPLLRHQKAEYLAVRLRAYRAGTLGSSAEVDVMQAIASGLDDASISALATWIASAP